MSEWSCGMGRSENVNETKRIRQMLSVCGKDGVPAE